MSLNEAVFIPDSEVLNRVVDEIKQWMDGMASRNQLAHILHLHRAECHAEGLRTRLDEVLKLFQVSRLGLVFL